jgi:hypothetical protein
MKLYENDAYFASKPGQVAKDLEGIRQSLQDFIDMRNKLETTVSYNGQITRQIEIKNKNTATAINQ